MSDHPNLPLSDSEEKRLRDASMLRKTVIFKHKGLNSRRVMGTVVDEVSIIVGDYKHLIQRIEFEPGQAWGGNTYAYRTGYYTYQHGKKYVKWGQFTQFLTESEYKELLEKAKARGWPIF